MAQDKHDYTVSYYNKAVKIDDYTNTLQHAVSSRPSTSQRRHDRAIFEAWINDAHWLEEPYAPPITVVNDVDDEPCPPFEFEYVNRYIFGSGVIPPDPATLKGCQDCIEGRSCNIVNPSECSCAIKSYQCVKDQPGFYPIIAYDMNGSLRLNPSPIFECNFKCPSGPRSINRLVRRGRNVPLEIAKTTNRGWGVRSPIRLGYGTFIGCYMGEVITYDEMAAREQIQELTIRRNYIFELDFHHMPKHLSSSLDSADEAKGDEALVEVPHARYAVDGYFFGNVTRYINHSCDPNLWTVPIYIDNDDIELPLVAFFTRKEVQKGEELTYQYSGTVYDDENHESDADTYEHVSTGRKRARTSDDFRSKSKTHSKLGHGRKPSKHDALDRAKISASNECRCGASNCSGTMYKVQ